MDDEVSSAIELRYGPIAYGEAPSIVLLATIDQDGDKKCKAIATGFLVFSGQHLVLITAAHAFDRLNGQPVLAIGPDGTASLERAKLVKSESFDIAVAFLETDDLLQMFSCCRCVEPKVISDVSDSGVSAVYQLHGFPASKNEVSNRDGLKSFQIKISLGKSSNSLPARSAYQTVDSTPFCFDISLKHMLNDAFEKDSQLGSFKGLSGGPVIQHLTERDGRGYLVGMFIEWHKQSRTAVVVPWTEISQFIQVAVLY